MLLQTAYAWLWTHYHTRWVDPATILVAIVYAIFQRRRQRIRKPLMSRNTGWDVMNGLALFPLMLLMGSAFSDYLTDQLLTTNKVIMFAAGCFSLLAILEDRHDEDAAEDRG